MSEHPGMTEQDVIERRITRGMMYCLIPAAFLLMVELREGYFLVVVGMLGMWLDCKRFDELMDRLLSETQAMHDELKRMTEEEFQAHKAKFKVGDRVSFTRTTGGGNSFHLASREATIMVMGNVHAEVRLGNNRREDIHFSKLRLASERSELTEAVMGKKESEE